MSGEIWAIVLAAGDGTRLRSVATDALGVCTPKQFLTFGRSRSLLRTTIDRAETMIPPERIVTIVAATHAPWWRREKQAGSLGNILVQPRNAGTAAGLLLPLLYIRLQDPDATVLVLPSDHHVRDEERFLASLAQLVGAAREDAGHVMLLGMEPDGPEVQYGWIVPSRDDQDASLRPVDAFVEKPAPQDAANLLARGALWSTFVMAGRASAIHALFERATPDLTRRFEREEAWEAQFARDPERLRALYAGVPTCDFSADVLQHDSCRAALCTMRAPACGWTDLGTPERVARAFPSLGRIAGLAPLSIPPAAAAQQHLSHGA